MVGLNTPKNSSGSAYPLSIEGLLPRVRAWVADLGSDPSRNRIMTEFRVGAPKANAILEALKSERESAPVRTLRSVPEPATDAAQDADTDTSGDQEQPPAEAQVTLTTDSGPRPARTRAIPSWPLLLLALPAFVAIWGGWVGLGRLTGFGPIELLPGIWDGLTINSAITLPIGVETYAAFAMRVWLSGAPGSEQARDFAKWSAVGSLVLGMAGQIAYHQMSAAGVTHAPWLITTLVSCLPVAVLGCGAALAHLLHTTHQEVND
jgi:hypothetical protein